jgi:hypothetical protein
MILMAAFTEPEILNGKFASEKYWLLVLVNKTSGNESLSEEFQKYIDNHYA